MGVADDARRAGRRIPAEADPREMPHGLGDAARTHGARHRGRADQQRRRLEARPRAAQNYYTEANACLGIMAYIKMVDDPLVVHEHLSQRDEELMHFMEGKFQLDFYCTTPESQKHVEDALGYLLHQIGGFGPSPQPAAAPRKVAS